MKTSKLCITGLCAGISPGPVNSPHIGPVTRKMFPFDDVIMSHGHHGVSIHHQMDRLFHYLFMLASKKTSKVCITGFLWWESISQSTKFIFEITSPHSDALYKPNVKITSPHWNLTCPQWLLPAFGRWVVWMLWTVSDWWIPLRKGLSWWCHQMETLPRYWPFVRGIHQSRWIPRTKASDVELWCFRWSAPE